ncbi:putative ribosome-binding factor A, mitochondrial [Alosa sapidissima]|uniref:putative ribosome-binding factor A, mitochondrial n=1 Tax=Alosa sapidissima TaxID=34773 RepID=UPI001C08BF6D|nr:putative ribosome-binding factor A, mitochondrial [Alosa sapidissima]XP_041963316.1 putative ribosome-binding factor A, mitochondrial [Alosa sapidissima]
MFAQSIKKFVSFRCIARSGVWINIPQTSTNIAVGSQANTFHACNCQLGSNKLMKMLKGERSKKQWYDTPPQKPPGSHSILKLSKKRNPEENSRLRVLNGILFKAISDLLASHEISPELPHLNVEISKVSLSPDYSACRIYWKTCGTSERDAQIQQLLDKSGPRIRYLLTSQQVLGSVPAIVFIRDKQYAALNEIDNLLKAADFGPDEEWIETASVKKSGVKSHSSDHADHQQQPSERKGPVLFGVDHDALLKQIEEYKQQARDPLPLASTAALTQQQLDAVAEFRKHKLIEKKMKKSKKMIDDDITPKAYLLAKHSEQKPLEDLDDDRHEDNQISELMAEDNRRP